MISKPVNKHLYELNENFKKYRVSSLVYRGLHNNSTIQI